MTKILSVEPTATPDQLRVTGVVGEEEVSVTVWRSHLYGELIDPDAKHKLGRGAAYERAPDHESNPGPRDPGVPRTDAQRRAYLVSELEAAASTDEADAALGKLVG